MPFGTARLFRSKLSPPMPLSHPFRRERLLHRLHAGWKRKLTVITAPAGYGKTSLLQSWTAGERRPIGWLRLDPRDDELRRFLFYFLHAIPLLPDSYQDDCSGWMQEADPGLLTMELESIAAQWIAYLDRIDRQLMIVVDGFETVRHPDILRFLTLFLRFSPPHVHVVLSGRHAVGIEPPRSEDGGSETLTAEDLALTNTELFHFTLQQTSVRLTESELHDLTERTQGWFIGVNAYLPFIRNQGCVRGDPDFHSQAEQETAAYFHSLIRAEAHPSLLQTLMNLSAARQLDGSLTKQLTEGAEQSMTLAELSRKAWFLFPLGEQPGQYVFHPMFSSFLRRELRETSAETYAALQRKCAIYSEEEGQYIRAAEHAFEAGDRERAADVLLRHAPGLLREGNLLPLLERFTEAEMRQRPELGYMYGLSLIHARRIHAAEQIANMLDAAAADGRSVTLASTGEPLSGYLAALRSMIHFSKRETDLGLFYMKQTESELSGPGKLHRSSLYFHPYTSSILGGKYGHYGVLKSALVTYEYCLPRWGRQDTAYAVMLVGMGECCYEEGKLDRSEEHLRQGLQLSLDLNHPGIFVPAFLAWAQLKWRKGEKEAAWAALQEAREQLLQRNLRARLTLVDACEAKLRVREQDAKYVRKWIQSPAVQADSPNLHVRMFEAIVLLRAYSFLGKTAEALSLGAKLLQAALSLNHPRDLIEVNLLLAQIHRKQGDVIQALEKLDRALSEAHAQGYVQMVVDEGAALTALLKEYRKRCRLKDKSELAEFAGVILKAIPKDETPAGANTPITDSLTHQEKRVFQLLVKGASNRTIADALSISIETAKKHCRHVYRKLGVANRKQAAQQYLQLQGKTRV